MATEVELVEGLKDKCQNCRPYEKIEIGEINNLLNLFYPDVFYYNNFILQNSFWFNFLYRMIRKAAGMGVAPLAPDPDR